MFKTPKKYIIRNPICPGAPIKKKFRRYLTNDLGGCAFRIEGGKVFAIAGNHSNFVRIVKKKKKKW